MAECSGCHEVKRDAGEKIAALKELMMQRVGHLEVLTEERVRTTNQALELQTRETERRLTALNGEAERLRIMQATYLPLEVFETVSADMHKSLTDLKAFKDTAAGRQSIMTVLIAAAISLAGSGVTYLLLHRGGP